MKAGLLRCAVAALWAYACAAGADCLATHPTSRVTEKLALPRYESCDAVRQAYAEQHAEQVRLLRVLRPAYERKLERHSGAPASAASASAATLTRLRQYDENLLRLRDIGLAWGQLILAADAASIPASSRKDLRDLLKASRVTAQTLSDRVAASIDQLGADEVPAYCKLDYSFRFGNGLHAKLGDCVKAK